MNKVIHYIISSMLVILGLMVAGGIYVMYAGAMDIPNNSVPSIIITLAFTLLPAYYFFRLARGKINYTLITRIAEILELVVVSILLTFAIKTFTIPIQGVSFPLPSFFSTSIVVFVLIGSHLLALILLGADYIKSRL